MPLVYVFASSKAEAKPVLELARQPGRPAAFEAGGNQLAVIITGMGTGNARRVTDAALGLAADSAEGGKPQKPDAILMIGLCGGLTEVTREGQIVVYIECLSTEQAPLPCSLSLNSAILEILQERQIDCSPVAGITSSRIASTKNDKLALSRRGASVVDMESYQVLSAAARAGIPAAVMRVVADPLDARMPDFNSALDANGGLSVSRAIWIALESPLQTLRLIAGSKRAMARLTPAVKWVLQSNCFSNLRRAERR